MDDEARAERIRPNKTLGQNFLTSKAALAKIADAGEIAPGETVVEIGPGKGALTDELLGRGARVIAIEKDRRLAALLREKYADRIADGSLRLIEGDALETDIPEAAGGSPYKIIANIPYYITGAFIRKGLTGEPQPALMVLLVQKEVADRIAAKDGPESLLSISVKAYGEPARVSVVKAGSFNPPPAVDSAILAIRGISKRFFDDVSEEWFFEVVKAGFSHKRKVLRGNLSGIAPASAVVEALTCCGLGENARAEELAPETWRRLASELANGAAK